MDRPGDRPGEPRDRDNVIALSRYRAELGRSRRLRRGDTLLSGPDPERAVRALPGDELYYVIHELGLREAGDILAYARPEQVQIALDFALWERDRIAPQRLAEWLEAMADAPHERSADWLAGLDVELLALFLRRTSRIYDLSQEEPPDEPEGTFYATPDGFFVLDVGAGTGGDGDASTPEAGADDDLRTDGDQLDDDDGGGDEGSPVRAVLRLLDGLYRTDKDLARRILVGARAELDSELEELAYRWRQGRMADLGFADYHEALEVYRELDPASVRVGEAEPGRQRVRPLDVGAGAEPAARLPALLIDRVGAAATPFARAVRGLVSADETAELHFALVSLTNRVLAADRVPPGDDAAVKAVLERMAATLDLAIEFLARGDDEAGREAVRTIPLMRLHRLGVSLVGKVRRLALMLRKKGPFAATGRDLAEPEDAVVLEAAMRPRPLYAAALDEPPGAGERPFRSLADLARATAAIERAAAAQAMLVGLGVAPRDVAPGAPGLEGTAAQDDNGALDAGVLARTILVGRLLGGEPRGLAPLRPPDVRAFEARLEASAQGPPRLPDAIRKQAKAILDAGAPGQLAGAAAAVAERWIASLAPLDPVLVLKKPAPAPGKR
jgi:hypothetical protein